MDGRRDMLSGCMKQLDALLVLDTIQHALLGTRFSSDPPRHNLTDKLDFWKPSAKVLASAIEQFSNKSSTLRRQLGESTAKCP